MSITEKPAFDWNNVKRFNFTFAINGGAWLEDSTGNVNWFSYDMIKAVMGPGWFERQRKAQGTFTGCWIDVISETLPVCAG